MPGISVVTGGVSDRGNIVPSRSNPTASRGSNKAIASRPKTTRKATDKVNTQLNKAVNQASLEYIEGELEIIPTPYFKAKSLYHIHGVGEPFEGIYYTKKVTHKIGSDGYTVDSEVFQVEKIPPSESTNTRKPQVKPKVKPNYTLIERVGTVTATHGLHVRNGSPFNLKVNGSGYVTSPSQRAPVIGKLRKGTRIKVKLKQGDWYYVYYKRSGGWCYSKYIRF